MNRQLTITFTDVEGSEPVVSINTLHWREDEEPSGAGEVAKGRFISCLAGDTLDFVESHLEALERRNKKEDQLTDLYYEVSGIACDFDRDEIDFGMVWSYWTRVMNFRKEAVESINPDNKAGLDPLEVREDKLRKWAKAYNRSQE